MRRYWREHHEPGMFRGGELPRLMTGIIMLAVIYMLIVRLGDPSAWRWLARDGDKPTESTPIVAPKSPQSAPPLPATTGPTDEDPDEAETAREEFQAITDGTLTLQREEMEPYDRIALWVQNQSFAQLRRRARSDLLFTHVYDQPDRYRGQLVTFDLNVRRILPAEKNRDGIALSEVWGVTRESGNRLYVAMIVDLPDGMPIGPSVKEKAKFAGYFLKLQGYHASGATPGTASDKSPLLIGRLQWRPPAVSPPADNTRDWIWGLGLLTLIGLATVARFVYGRWKGQKPVAPSTKPQAVGGEVIPIEQWLERASFDVDDRADQ